VVNKQPLIAYSNIRKDGINAMHLDAGDRMIECKLTNGNKRHHPRHANGQAVRFHESAARELGRNTRGVRGIRLVGNDRVVSMVIVDESNLLLTVTETASASARKWRNTARPTGADRASSISRPRSATALWWGSSAFPTKNNDIMLITKNGIIIRSDVNRISVIGRNTQGCGSLS